VGGLDRSESWDVGSGRLGGELGPAVLGGGDHRGRAAAGEGLALSGASGVRVCKAECWQQRAVLEVCYGQVVCSGQCPQKVKPATTAIARASVTQTKTGGASAKDCRRNPLRRASD
jgi:hypothetical protein